MPSYVVTGVSRGIGWAFLETLSSDANNTIYGIVRDKVATDKRVVKELSGRSNITIVEADLTKYDAIKAAASTIGAATGGKLDYIIANAAYMTLYDGVCGIKALADDPTELSSQFHKLIDTNVLANIHLYNLFIPLILKGRGKKVIVISSGAGDYEWVKDYDIVMSPLYATSKAAMNMVNAKFSAQYKEDGVLFLSICPGMVDTGYFGDLTPEQQAFLGGEMAKFAKYSSDFKGPASPENAVKAVLAVMNSKSLGNGDGGAAVSHLGTKRWI